MTARVLQRHLGKYIPGNPTVIVQNQPGAGSITMVNQVVANGPFDGTVIGATFNGLPTTPLLQPTGVRFDPNKMQWIGSTNRETQVTYLWHTAPVKTFAEIAKTEVVTGAQAPGTTQYDYPCSPMRCSVTSTRWSPATRARRTFHLAMERGEIHGASTNWSTLLALNGDWVEEKKVRMRRVSGAFEKHRDLPNDAPLALEPCETPEADKAALRLEGMGRGWNTAGRSSCRRACRRTASTCCARAFDATMKDPEFLADAEKLKLEIDPMSGAEIATMLQDIAKTPADVVERVKAAYAAR